MRRPLYALMTVLGVVLGAFGVYHVAVRQPLNPPRFVTMAPSQTTVTLTPGNWDVYDQVGTGRDGTTAVVQVAVTAPNGTAVPVYLPADPPSVRTGGISYAESVTMHISAASNYVVQITPTSGPSLKALVTKSLHPRFPWGGLIVDGVVLGAAGVGLSAYEKRRRQTLAALEEAYAAERT